MCHGSSCNKKTQWLFWGIFVQKLFETILNFRHQWVKNLKKLVTFDMSILKVSAISAFIFSDFLLVRTQEWDLFQYFLEKESKKAGIVKVSVCPPILILAWENIAKIGRLLKNQLFFFYFYFCQLKILDIGRRPQNQKNKSLRFGNELVSSNLWRRLLLIFVTFTYYYHNFRQNN